MKKGMGFFLIAFSSILLMCVPKTFPQEKEIISLKSARGPVQLILELESTEKPWIQESKTMVVSLIGEKGKISLIGEKGILVGFLNKKGRFKLSPGVLAITLVDKEKGKIGLIKSTGKVVLLEQGFGSLSLIGEKGKTVGYIGENGLVAFKK